MSFVEGISQLKQDEINSVYELMRQKQSYKDEIKAGADDLIKKKIEEESAAPYAQWLSSDSYEKDLNAALNTLKRNRAEADALSKFDKYKETDEYKQRVARIYSQIESDDDDRIKVDYEKELEKTKAVREEEHKRRIDSKLSEAFREEEDLTIKEFKNYYSKTKRSSVVDEANATSKGTSDKKKRCVSELSKKDDDVVIKNGFSNKFVARSTLRTDIDRSKPKPPFTAKIARDEYGLKGWRKTSFFTRQIDSPHHIFHELDTSLSQKMFNASKSTVEKWKNEKIVINGFEWGIDIRDYVLDFTENKKVDEIGQKIIDQFNGVSKRKPEQYDVSDSEATDSEDDDDHDTSPKRMRTDSSSSSLKHQGETSNICTGVIRVNEVTKESVYYQSVNEAAATKTNGSYYTIISYIVNGGMQDGKFRWKYSDPAHMQRKLNEKWRCVANVDNRLVTRDRNSFYARKITTGVVYLYASASAAAHDKSIGATGCAISKWVDKKAKNEAGYDWGISGSWIPIEEANAVSIPAIPLESSTEQDVDQIEDLEEKYEDNESLPMPITKEPYSSGSSQPSLTPSVPFEASKTVARSPCPAPVLPRLPSTVR